MPRQYGSNGSIFDTLSTQVTDDNGIPLLDTSTTIGSSPLGISLREQIQFGLPNASFNLLPYDVTAAISNEENPLPYWDVQTTADITATALYNSTTQTWGIKIDPGTAPSGDYLTLKTRSWVVTDDNLALRQKASLTLAKNGSYAGATQYNVTLSAVYYDSTNTALGTTAIGTALDNATMSTISGFTTAGGTAIPSSASWAEFTIKLTVTSNVTSSTSVTLQSLLLATSSPATNSFLVTDTFTASGTWTRPTGVSYVNVVGVGGGGGGAGGGCYASNLTTAANGWGGPSGASSTWAVIQNVYVGGTTSVSVGIGTAGAAGTAKTFSKAAAATTVNTGAAENSGNGGAGGATTFGAYLSIGGGGGGISQSSVGGAGTAAGAPTSTVYGLAFLGAVAGKNASSVAGADGSAATFSQLPFWPATFTSGAAGSNGTASGATTNYIGTAGASGSAGVIGGGASGGRPEWNGTNFTALSTNGAIGGYGAGSGGGQVGARIGATQTVIATAGAGGAGAANAGGGGGGGGGAFVVTSSVANYNASTITVTSGAGGAGGAGRLYVVYVG